MELTLEYWNSLANQLILICSLLSGFSIAIVANLIVSEKNTKLINRLLITATISAGCFLISLFAMTNIAMVTTPGGQIEHVTEKNFAVSRVIGMATFMIGLFSLSILLALSGWTKSKKVGIVTTIIGVLTLLFILLVKTNIEL